MPNVELCFPVRIENTTEDETGIEARTATSASLKYVAMGNKQMLFYHNVTSDGYRIPTVTAIEKALVPPELVR